MSKYLLFLLAPLICLLASSCVKEEQFLADSSARLYFSSDTVSFDTVFTAMTPATQYVKVYNRYDEPLLIDAVTVEGPCANRFRINVDGDTGRVARNVEIGAHDSIYIFVQANINPNDQTSPFLIEADIVFNFNKKQQKLPIIAYGRNAVYHHPTYPHSIYKLYLNSRG